MKFQDLPDEVPFAFSLRFPLQNAIIKKKQRGPPMKELSRFLETSYTAYQAVDNARAYLLAHGFCELRETDAWELKPDGNYFAVRGGSALIAFRMGDARQGFKIVASHTDSPALKLKENPALSDGNYTRLNTEPYGGGLWYTFFDRPLRLAGRVVREREGALVSESFASDFPITLPSLAIHLNRNANEGFAPDKQKDLPVLALGKSDFAALLNAPVSYDLFAACAQSSYRWGENGEFLAAPRIDNLASVFASLTTLAAGGTGVCVAACLDSEEVGSHTRQGAAGDFLRAVLARIALRQNLTEEEQLCAYARSFCISLDNAQGFHPNHAEKYDPQDRAILGKGVAIKGHAGGAYTTDALSSAVIKRVFARADAPLQVFYNRSDARSGSTLGAISLGQACILTVDIGLPQLAMHSAVETIACADYEALEKGLASFWTAEIRMDGETVTVR